MIRRLWLVVLLVVALSVPAQAQWRGVRFEIAQVGDTTVSFSRGAEKWIRPGLNGVAVDPRQRDALVARLRIIAVENGRVTAVVTGQTTRLVPEHVVILDEPKRSWLKTPMFWGGMVLGAVIGALVGTAVN